MFISKKSMANHKKYEFIGRLSYNLQLNCCFLPVWSLFYLPVWTHFACSHAARQTARKIIYWRPLRISAILPAGCSLNGTARVPALLSPLQLTQPPKLISLCPNSFSYVKIPIYSGPFSCKLFQDFSVFLTLWLNASHLFGAEYCMIG